MTQSFLQATKDIDKESENIEVSVLNTKDVVDNFLGLGKKYGLVHLASSTRTENRGKYIFR